MATIVGTLTFEEAIAVLEQEASKSASNPTDLSPLPVAASRTHSSQAATILQGFRCELGVRLSQAPIEVGEGGPLPQMQLALDLPLERGA